MKRFTALVISFSLIFSAAGYINIFAEEDVILSQSFEEDVKPWKTTSSSVGDKFEVVDKEATDGNKSLRIYDDSDETASGIRSGQVQIMPNYKYILTADVKLVSGNLTLYARFYDKDKKQISQSNHKCKVGEMTGVKLNLISPENAQYVELIIQSSASTVGEAFVDNIVIKSLGKVTQADIDIVTALTKQFMVNTNTKAGEVAMSDSFEEGLISWKTYNPGVDSQFEITDKDKTDGNKSLRIWDDSKTTKFGVRSNYIPVKEFTRYNLSVDLKPVGGNAGVYFRIYDNNKNQINVTSKNGTLDKWSTISLDIESGYNCGFVEIIIYNTDASSTGEFYIDNIKITDMGEVARDEKSGKMQEEISAKLNSAKPGDVIKIPDGDYKDVNLLISTSGEEGNPITLKAENDGMVTFSGKSQIKITGSYIVISGLKFYEATSEMLIRCEPESHHCVITNSMFYKCDHEDVYNSQQNQIYLRGQYHTVSKCYFRTKSSIGKMVVVVRDGMTPDYHTIENCYFGDFKAGTVNGLETIRIGTSDTSQSYSNSVIKNNFFEQCNGENELISLKSGGNKVLYNTFYNSKGSMHFRQGNSSMLEGNVFVGPKKSNVSCGVVIHDHSHIVRNNYFYGMPEGCETIRFSDSDPRDWLHGFWPVKNVDVSNNTFVDVDYGVQAGYYYVPSDPETMAMRTNPPSGTFNNNAIITYKGSMPIIENQDAKRVNDTPYGNGLKHSITFENNFVTGKAVGYEGGTPSGVTEGKFDYEITDGFVVPKNGLGADLEEIKKAPKSPYDVMPKWVKEQYYDTGIIKFEPLPYDPFNTDFDLKTILPEEGKINVIMNGKRKIFDVDPQLINSRTMVPLRAIFEEFGAEVSWDETTATATAVSNLNTIKITENSATGYVNDTPVTLDSPAVIVDGRFLVPLRFISEAYGAEVSWVDATETAVINYNKQKILGMETAYEPYDHGIDKALYMYATEHTSDNGAGAVFSLMFDGNFGSRWAFEKNEDGSYGYGLFDFKDVKTFDKLYISYLNGNQRVYEFSILVSDDKVNFTPVLTNAKTSGTTDRFEVFDLNGVKGRFIKLEGHGNSSNDWNNISEIIFTGK